MRTIYFSPSRIGFYPESDKEIYDAAGSWPDDGVAITEDLWRELLDGQANGKVITPNGNDLPYLSDPPPPSHDELVSSAVIMKSEMMKEASIQISTLQDAVDFDMATDEEAQALISWKKYRVLLNRIDTSNPPVNWPDKPQ